MNAFLEQDIIVLIQNVKDLHRTYIFFYQKFILIGRTFMFTARANTFPLH